VLNARFRHGTPGDAEALATFATNATASSELRAEALHHLANWADPHPRDRVIGLYRPLPKRDGTVASKAFSKVFSHLLTGPELVQASAIKTATELNLKSLTRDLFSKFADDATPTSVRIAILNTLSAMDDPRTEEAAQIASSADNTKLRLATLPVLAKLSPDSSAEMLKHLVETGNAEEKQAAFKALGTMHHPTANQVLAASVRNLIKGSVPVIAQMELLEAAEAVKDPTVNEALKQYRAALAKTGDPIAPYEYALDGGDFNDGRAVFEKNGIMPCIRCHVSDGAYTGEPGPSLYGIASRVDKKYLLESVVKPSNKMAPGFEMAVVTTKSGDTLAGFVNKETADSLVLKMPDGTENRVAKSEIANRQTAPSTMPEIFATSLSRKDMRDLVAFLGSLVVDPEKRHDDIEEY
ncbi:MAG: c-type cytochrome, partial [Verrucomicrobiae bacterium]|nr:c-type cytochrome [Verrucomicrobiae bacterium]